MNRNEPELVEMPEFYFSRLRESDRSFIEIRMRVIPENKRHEVAKKYTNLYLSASDNRAARRNANTYLNNVALEYKNRVYNDNKKVNHAN